MAQLAPALTLRQDLRLYEGPKVGPAPSWMLYDPLRHKYFQIDRIAFAVLGAWTSAETGASLYQHLARAGSETLTRDDVDRIVAFAETNELVEASAGGWRMHGRRAEAAKSSALMWLVHNYLFIKIPVFRPRSFFERTSWLVALFYTRAFLAATLLAAVTGLYLVSRQWSDFIGTFPGLVSFDGAMTYAAALFGVKLCHELGHAYTAARYKCRVSSLGIAFMVMMPMLYCDVTDSWRLSDRRKRMAIDCAGIAAELILAVYAMLLWVLTPPGPPRTVAFVVASTSLVSSIAVNLNPFMRFDGYLMLSDMLNVPNLQTRAFALFRWKLREGLFKLGERKPEVFTPKKTTLLLVYAAAIIVYRAVVYAGIALLVYHAFFKLLGIALFAVEVCWFLVGPVAREMMVWWTMRDRLVVSRRAKVTCGAAALLLLLLIAPFRSSVIVPAVLEPAIYARIFPTAPGRIVSVAVRRGDTVRAGDELAELASPMLEQDVAMARIRLSLVEARLGRRSSVAEDKAATLSLEMEKRLLIEKIDGLDREKRDLVLKSPIDGVVRDLDPDLDIGRWVGRDAEIAFVAATDGAIVRGYMRQDGLDKVQAGDIGTFYPDAGLVRSEPATLTSVAYAAATRIDVPYLTSINGGPIAAREGADHGSVPDYAVFPTTFSVSRHPGKTVERGTVIVPGRRESLFVAMARNVGRILVRESGF